MFPGGRPPSIFSAEKLNYCVRNGNRCDLLAITTRETFRFINETLFNLINRIREGKYTFSHKVATIVALGQALDLLVSVS